MKGGIAVFTFKTDMKFKFWMEILPHMAWQPLLMKKQLLTNLIKVLKNGIPMISYLGPPGLMMLITSWKMHWLQYTLMVKRCIQMYPLKKFGEGPIPD